MISIAVSLLVYQSNFFVDHLLTLGSSVSGMSTLKSNTGRRNHDCKSGDFSGEVEKIDFKSSTACLAGFHGSNMALTHSETVHTTLYRENGIFGLECMDSSDGSVIISSVINGSPAEKYVVLLQHLMPYIYNVI